jgi:adenylate cyclase
LQSIAVLPFANLSGDAAYDYLGEGFSEELIDRLSSVPGLLVSARTSSAYFTQGRKETVQTIGKTLGVRHVVEGSVRKSGNLLRITAQLIDTNTGYHLWSQSFDRPFTDVLEVQTEISFAILGGLDIPIMDKARAAIMRHSTTSADALDLYLQARRLDQKWEVAENQQAIALYEKAIAIDPNFAAAYLRLAHAMGARIQIAQLWKKESEQDPREEELFRRAIELNPNSADAHAMLARSLFASLDMEGVRREMRIAESLNPNRELALEYLSQLNSFVGWPPEKAIDYAERWVRIDPLNPWAACNVAIGQQNAFRFADSLRTLDQVIEREPDYWVAHFVRTWTLHSLGRHPEALASARRALELHDAVETRTDMVTTHAAVGETRKARKLADELLATGGNVKFPPNLHAQMGLALRDREMTLSALERGYAERDQFIVNILLSPDAIALHGEPRFHKIVRELGLEQRLSHTARHAEEGR